MPTGAIPKAIRWIRDGSCMMCTSHGVKTSLYPEAVRNGRRMKICRHILFRRYGSQPSSIVSRHTCDRKFCINPDHIIPGTHQDNLRDRDERRLQAYGERNGFSKLKEHQVREIRQLCREGYLPSALAPRFGVSVSLIKMIRLNQAWKHVV